MDLIKKVAFRLFQLLHVFMTFMLLESFIFKTHISVLSWYTLGLAMPIYTTVHFLMAQNIVDLSYNAISGDLLFWASFLQQTDLLRYIKYRALEVSNWIPSHDVIGDAGLKATFQKVGQDAYHYALEIDPRSGKTSFDEVLSLEAAKRQYFIMVDAYYTGTRYKQYFATLFRIGASPFTVGRVLQQWLRLHLFEMRPESQQALGKVLKEHTPLFLMLSVPVAWLFLARRQHHHGRPALA